MKRFVVETAGSDCLIGLPKWYYLSINRNFRLKGDKHFLIILHSPRYIRHKVITGKLKEKIISWYLNEFLTDTEKWYSDE